VPNTLAYYDRATITAVKKFYSTGPWRYKLAADSPSLNFTDELSSQVCVCGYNSDCTANVRQKTEHQREYVCVLSAKVFIMLMTLLGLITNIISPGPNVIKLFTDVKLDAPVLTKF
jgi:hypothetical protein